MVKGQLRSRFERIGLGTKRWDSVLALANHEPSPPAVFQSSLKGPAGRLWRGDLFPTLKELVEELSCKSELKPGA